MMRGAKYDPYMAGAIQNIRGRHWSLYLNSTTFSYSLQASGRYLIIALTNNFIAPYNSILATPPNATFGTPEAELEFLGWTEGAVPQTLKDLFDDFIDSSQVGMRKPEPEFFLYACKKHNLKPEEVIMLDDLGL